MKLCCFNEYVPKQLLKIPRCWPTVIKNVLMMDAPKMTALMPFSSALDCLKNCQA